MATTVNPLTCLASLVESFPIAPIEGHFHRKKENHSRYVVLTREVAGALGNNSIF
jgi:hypothetical protein